MYALPHPPTQARSGWPLRCGRLVDSRLCAERMKNCRFLRRFHFRAVGICGIVIGAYLPGVRRALRGAGEAGMSSSVKMRKHPKYVLYRKAGFARESTRLRQSRMGAARGPVRWVRPSGIILVFGALAGAAAAARPLGDSTINQLQKCDHTGTEETHESHRA